MTPRTDAAAAVLPPTVFIHSPTRYGSDIGAVSEPSCCTLGHQATKSYAVVRLVREGTQIDAEEYVAHPTAAATCAVAGAQSRTGTPLNAKDSGASNFYVRTHYWCCLYVIC